LLVGPVIDAAFYPPRRNGVGHIGPPCLRRHAERPYLKRHAERAHP